MRRSQPVASAQNRLWIPRRSFEVQPTRSPVAPICVLFGPFRALLGAPLLPFPALAVRAPFSQVLIARSHFLSLSIPIEVKVTTVIK